LAWRAEDLLSRLVADREPPALRDAGAGAYAAAWSAWWQANEGRIDLAQFHLAKALQNLTLICEAHLPNGLGRIWACDRRGQARWSIAVHNPIDARVLPGNRILVANCNSNQIVELDTRGKVRWEYRVNYPVSCQRLPGGNTFIATYTHLMEVTPRKKTVYSYAISHGLYSAVKQRTGHIVYIHRSGHVVELDAAGKEVRRILVGGTTSWGGVEPLPNGHYLVAQCDNNRVVEVNRQGQVLWKCEVQSPALATRLRNGHVLVSSINGHRCVEVDRAGKVVWKQNVQGRLFRVRRY
jgi:outer membrane protein assembly factor BamB